MCDMSMYEEMLNCFNENVYESLDKIKDNLNLMLEKIEEISKEKKCSDAYYQGLKQIIRKFIEQIDSRVLMKKLDDFWSYECGVVGNKLSLFLVHYTFDGYLNEEGDNFLPDERFCLFEVKPEYLTIEEYSSRYSVEEMTVRQWIRRGKLRNANKTKAGWRISELEDLPSKGYCSAKYKWDRDEIFFEGEYEFLNRGDWILVEKIKREAGAYKFSLYEGEIEEKCPIQVIHCDAKTRERHEMFFVRNSFIEYVDDKEKVLLDICWQTLTN